MSSSHLRTRLQDNTEGSKFIAEGTPLANTPAVSDFGRAPSIVSNPTLSSRPQAPCRAREHTNSAARFCCRCPRAAPRRSLPGPSRSRAAGTPARGRPAARAGGGEEERRERADDRRVAEARRPPGARIQFILTPRERIGESRDVSAARAEAQARKSRTHPERRPFPLNRARLRDAVLPR